MTQNNIVEKIKQIFEEAYLDSYGEESYIYKSSLESKVLAVVEAQEKLLDQKIFKKIVSSKYIDEAIKKRIDKVEELEGRLEQIQKLVQIFPNRKLYHTDANYILYVLEWKRKLLAVLDKGEQTK